MTEYKFKKGSLADYLESIMQIDNNGGSDWYNVLELNKKAINKGFQPIRGNGSPVFQKDRGFGKKYEIEKSRENSGALHKIRTRGFSSYFNRNRGVNIPKEIRAKLVNQACVHCGSNHVIEIDHCNGRKDPDIKIEESEFQPLCKHCNALKRERCKKCESTGRRFDAKDLGYSVSYLSSKHYAGAREGCRGCYMYRPIEFKKALKESI